MNDKKQIQPLQQESLELETKLDADKTTCDRILAENAKTEAEVKRKFVNMIFTLKSAKQSLKSIEKEAKNNIRPRQLPFFSCRHFKLAINFHEVENKRLYIHTFQMVTR